MSLGMYSGIKATVWKKVESTKQSRKMVGQVAGASSASVKQMLLMHMLVFVQWNVR